jgi:hypothetical protein
MEGGKAAMHLEVVRQAWVAGKEEAPHLVERMACLEEEAYLAAGVYQVVEEKVESLAGAHLVGNQASLQAEMVVDQVLGVETACPTGARRAQDLAQAEPQEVGQRMSAVRHCTPPLPPPGRKRKLHHLRMRP